MIKWPRLLNPTQLIQILKSQKNPLTALKIFHEVPAKYPNYRHNGPAYAAMIDILGSSSKLSEMKSLIESMKKDSCECKDSIFVSAINHYARAGLLNDSISLFKSIPTFNCVDNSQSLLAILSILMERGDFEEAGHLFVKSSSGWEAGDRINLFNYLIDSLCRLNKSHLALKIFLEMGNQGFYPNRESYRLLMRGLCKAEKFTDANDLLDLMFRKISAKGSGEDVVIYGYFLDALCEKGKIPMAVEMLEKILHKGLKAPKQNRHPIDLNHPISEDLPKLKRLFHESLVKNVSPGAANYTSVAINLYNEGKLSEANEVLRVALKRNFRPLGSVFEAKMEALFNGGRIDEAVGVIEEMVGANYAVSVRHYNVVLKGLCGSGNSASAYGYFERMTRQTGCVPDGDTYVTLVRGFCEEGLFLKASGVLEKMVIRSHWPPVDVFEKVIIGLCSIGRRYEAVLWLEEMVSEHKVPRSLVWNSLVKLVCYDGFNASERRTISHLVEC